MIHRILYLGTRLYYNLMQLLLKGHVRVSVRATVYREEIKANSIKFN